VTLNMVVFWLTVLVLFWISGRGEEPVASRERSGVHQQPLLGGSSEEAQPT